MTSASQPERLGPAVQNGAVRYVSPSQIDKFDAAAGGCARRWWFRYVDRRPEPERAAATQGTQVHAQIEHYLKTGEDVLGEVARAGRAWIPAPGSDLLVEHEFGGARGGEIVSAISAAGIPVIGKVDLMHARGETITTEGEAQPEPGACEVVDWKSTSNIGYAKSAAAIASAWPMLAYGEVARAAWPGAERVRLSHVYFSTRGPRAAEKRTAIVPVARVAEGWRRADALVERMKSAAGETRVESLAPNLNACGSYGGCPHREYCPRDPGQILASIFRKGSAMPNTDTSAAPASRPSLLQRVTAQAVNTAIAVPGGATAVAASLPPVALPASDRSAIEAEKARLLAEESARRASVGAVAPPDAPAPSRTHEPIPAEAPAELRRFAHVTDEEIRAGGDRIAAELAAAADPGPAPGALSPPCQVSGTQRILSIDEVAARKIACACGAKLKVKPQKIGDKYAAIVPAHGGFDPTGHREPKVDLTAQPPLPIPTEPPPARAAVVGSFALTGRAPYPEETPPDVDIQAARSLSLGLTAADALAGGIDLYLDCYPDGVRCERLEAYAEPICRALEASAHAAELRCAPADGPLSFGKWRGALAAAVRATPPAPGAYVADTRGEIAAVVAEALAPVARRVVRGVRS